MESKPRSPSASPHPRPTVVVVCGAASHSRKIVMVGCFGRSAGDGWALLPPRGARNEWGMEHLYDDDTPLGESEFGMTAEPVGPTRRRYGLRCRLCDLSVPARAEKLHPLLDRLAEHADAWKLDLSELRTILR